MDDWIEMLGNKGRPRERKFEPNPKSRDNEDRLSRGKAGRRRRALRREHRRLINLLRLYANRDE